jgi:predicted membrane-bound spermidine synthase
MRGALEGDGPAALDGPVEAGGLNEGNGSTEGRASSKGDALAAGLKKGALGGLVFFAGIGTMATEMCASRLIAPYYGSSTVIWANIIGLILIALSLGYVLGGKLADRRPSARVLGIVVLAGAVLTAVVPFVARPFLNVTINGIDSVSTGAVIGSFFACVILFVPSVLLLGMVTPFAIRIGIRQVDKAGSTAGRIFALSTAGSLVGTFLPPLLTIPLFGTQRTLVAGGGGGPPPPPPPPAPRPRRSSPPPPPSFSARAG